MELTLTKGVVLSLDLTSAINLPAGTVLIALMPGQYVPGGGPLPMPGVPLVNRPMASWQDYTFSPNLKVMVRDTGQVGFLARETVIELWHSPFVDGTPADRWCAWQLSLIESPGFARDFRQGVLSALTSGTHSPRSLLASFERFNAHFGNLRRVSGDAVQSFRTLEGEPLVLFRFYTGEQHGLLPKVLTARYQAGQRIDPMALFQERAPQPPPRLPPPSSLPPPSLSPSFRSPFFKVPERPERRAVGPSGPAMAGPSAAAFSEDMRPMGMRVDSASHGASAHGQGYTSNSPLVSTGPSLPNLIASPSKKLRVILFGRDIFPPPVRPSIREDQATHLGVFFVPGNMWRSELTGNESQLEREVVYDGFTDSGYEGLWECEMFTLRNPYRASSGYAAPLPAQIKFFQYE